MSSRTFSPVSYELLSFNRYVQLTRGRSLVTENPKGKAVAVEDKKAVETGNESEEVTITIFLRTVCMQLSSKSNKFNQFLMPYNVCY